MIPRYDKKEISDIWKDEYKFKKYLQVELAILKALEEKGDIPNGVVEHIRKNAVINPARIDQIEQKVRHDVIAFCTSITENLDKEMGRFFHFGVTSSDVIDSALTLQLRDSLDVVIPSLKKLLKVIKSRAVEMKNVVCIGRSHGMFAEPMSFGQKLLGFYSEFQRRLNDLEDFYKNELTVQFSGAVGSYTILTPELEKRAASILGLSAEPVSTQIIPRDRIAKLVGINGLIGTAIERMAVEIRHLHRSDVNELHEGFAKGQKGSSTMPHKKNPISGENLTGMARMLRSHVSIAMENVVLWHERDISHSGAERMYLPDNFGILFYSLERLTGTVSSLEFHQENIESKVINEQSYLSSYYLHYLLKNSELTREELYELVQKAAFAGVKENSAAIFQQTLENLLKEKGIGIDIPVLSFDQVKNVYLAHTDEIFKRVL